MAEANPPLEVTRGLPLVVELQYFDEADRALKLDGWTVKLFIGPAGQPARITKTLTIGAAARRKGLVPLKLTPQETAALLPGDGFAVKRVRPNFDDELIDEADFLILDTRANEVTP